MPVAADTATVTRTPVETGVVDIAVASAGITTAVGAIDGVACHGGDEITDDDTVVRAGEHGDRHRR